MPHECSIFNDWDPKKVKAVPEFHRSGFKLTGHRNSDRIGTNEKTVDREWICGLPGGQGPTSYTRKISE